jgi:hypothetical protein
MSFGSIVELKKYDNCTHVDAQIDVNFEVKKILAKVFKAHMQPSFNNNNK